MIVQVVVSYDYIGDQLDNPDLVKNNQLIVQLTDGSWLINRYEQLTGE